MTHLLPRRIGRRFAAVADKAIREAAVECRNNCRLTLEQSPEYPEEEKKQIEILIRLFDLKVKLVVAFRNHVDMVKNITSFDFLHYLADLDRIPIEQSPGLLPIMAASLNVDVETLTKLTTILRENVIKGLLQYLLRSADDPAERPVCERQYRLLLGAWLRKPEWGECLRLVDAPFPAMPAEVVQALQEGRTEEALSHLRLWHDVYPAFGGLAVFLANLLFERKLFDEAVERLRRSLPLILVSSTRRQVQNLLVQLILRKLQPYIDAENYPGALDVALTALAMISRQRWSSRSSSYSWRLR